MNVSRQKNALVKSRAAQRGLTLVELMVAIALGLFLSWGAIQAFLSGKKIYTTQQALSRIQENARLAQEFLGFDIRNAGTYGCVAGRYIANKSDSLTTLANSGYDEFNFENSVIGANDVSGAGSGDLTLQTPLTPPPLAGTDILVTHTATNLGLSVLDADDGVADPTSTQIITANMGLQAGDILSLSNCTSNIIFTPSSVSSAGSTSTITGSFGEVFAAGSTVMRLETSIYYVANNPAGRPSLYRRTLTGNSEELLQGVEDLQIEYALDTGGSVAGQVDSYADAGSVSADEWSAWGVTTEKLTEGTAQGVVGVRYSLLLVSENELLETPQTYTYNGVATTASDRRMRHIIGGTAGIRSRMNVDSK